MISDISILILNSIENIIRSIRLKIGSKVILLWKILLQISWRVRLIFTVILSSAYSIAFWLKSSWLVPFVQGCVEVRIRPASEDWTCAIARGACQKEPSIQVIVRYQSKY